MHDIKTSKCGNRKRAARLNSGTGWASGAQEGRRTHELTQHLSESVTHDKQKVSSLPWTSKEHEELRHDLLN